MKTYGTDKEEIDQSALTKKQRDVLDLLIENKTSKEIGRELGISPYTVDQRISLARGKLGVSSRNELAARYRVMQKMSGQSLSDISDDGEEERPEDVHEDEIDKPALADARHSMPQREREERNLTMSAFLEREGKACPTVNKADYRVGPEVFEGRAGGFWRISAIVATALLLVMTILGLFAIFDQLNDVLA